MVSTVPNQQHSAGDWDNEVAHKGLDGQPSPILSIIIPTRNEAGNIRPLLSRITQATKGLDPEVIFVDDSNDDTPEVVQEVAPQISFPVRLIARPLERRNGLSGAVVEGLRAACGQWVLVMDADLQHPPELIPRLYERALATNADIVVGSRLAAADGPIGLSRFRGATSRSLTTLARAFFPQALKNVSDPLTGLFLVRRSIVNPDALRPQGFKILLELLVRCCDARVAEVHFEFGERHAGDSKAGLNEAFRFFRHLLHLRLTANQHFTRFLTAGALGIGVNSLVLLALVVSLGWHYLVAAVLATQLSAAFNFVITEIWVFSDRRQEQLTGLRLARYLLMNNALLLLHLPLMSLLIMSGLHFLAANLAAILATTLVRYALSDDWIWTKKSIPLRPTYFTYDIHGLLGVESMVRLPELEYFRTDGPLSRTDIQVNIDRYGTPKSAPGDIFYSEGLGRLGFAVTIHLGVYTQVTGSPLLAKAPHVLYTNVVEPLLRWAFVRQDYALVHGTCVAYGEQAFLLAARSHSKFKTILRAPPEDGRRPSGRCFMGDEMVLLGRDGRLLAYPKPLLINEQLLTAVSGIDPSYGERIVLSAESRIYTWLGRRIGMGMRRLWLPAASFNAFVQMLFPPPKYMLHELLPTVPYCQTARLAAFALLAAEESGEEETLTPLSTEEAVDVVLANAVEAYAFPPYPTLAHWLSHWEGVDLHPVEETIIRAGLAKATIWHLRSPDHSWWERLPTLLSAIV